MHDANALPSPASGIVTRLFMVQYNLILLGGAALFSLALASPVPLLAAAAGELLWIGLGSNSAGIRRWLDRRQAALGVAGEERSLAPAVLALDPDYARRVMTLDRALSRLRELGGPRPHPAFVRAVGRLETVRPVYVGLCETHQSIGRFLATTGEDALAADVERLKAAFAAERDLGTRLTLRQALGSATRRIEHRQRMVELRRSIGVKLDSIERSLAYFVSQGLALVANAGLADDVEALLSEIGPAITVSLEPPESIRPPAQP